MIIYILGYGRSGTTAVSKVLERKLNAVNLGELKYIYRSEKDDLLDPYWINFKHKEREILTKELKSFDNIYGFIKLNQKTRYKDIWQNIFKKIGVNPDTSIIIDSSKTTMDSFMRGINLYNSFRNVYFISPKRNTFNTIQSMLKGKNSNLERGTKKNKLNHIFHSFFLGIPHLILTNVLSYVYKLYGVYHIDLKFLEDEIDIFIQKEKIKIMPKKINDLPMVYGNRMRLKNKE